MTADAPIVIVGGGHAGAQLCAALADGGAAARVHLVCEEPELPYHRPPLSKAYLKQDGAALQPLRTETWYTERSITLHRGDPVVAIDRAARKVRLRSGTDLNYARLVLATGARARRVAGWPHGLDNVAELRDSTDAANLRAQLHAASSVTVVGGGFIGLEAAATARALGKPVVVLESAPRLLARATSPDISAAALELHLASGMDVRLSAAIGTFDISGSRVVSLQVDGERLPVDLLLLGIGAVPNVDLAREAGLDCGDGVVVDARLVTSDPNILAIGDCANFPHHASATRMRLESIQNANDQARTAARTLLDDATGDPHRALPTFWSDQGPVRLQMAGLVPVMATTYRRPGLGENSFSVLHYVGDRLVCVESLNAPKDHLAARKLLEAGASPVPTLAVDPSRPLAA